MKRKSRSHHVPQAKTRNAASPPPVVPEHLGAVAAGIALSPEMAALMSINLMMGKDLKETGIGTGDIAKALKTQGKAVAGGDLDQVRRTLAAQVATLDQIFHHLFLVAYRGQLSHDQSERYIRLALKAQAQSAHTSQVLNKLSQEPQTRPAKDSTPAAAQATAPVVSMPAAPDTSVPNDQAMEGASRWSASASRAMHGLSAPAAR